MVYDCSPSAVHPNVLQERMRYLDAVEAKLSASIQWKECSSPAAYRKMRREGLNGFEAPILNPKARIITIPGRSGHKIELRIISQENQLSKGVWLHFHAGGFVIGSNASYDPYLTTLSDKLSMTVVSVEYRLAPESPFPAFLHDCTDAALFALSSAGIEELGAPLRILGGESAGGWIAISTALELRRNHQVDLQATFDAIVASYGIYDMTYTPSLLQHTRNIVLSKQGMIDFVEAAFGHIPESHRKDPLYSPLYADLSEMPPALFLTGAIEPLIDDSLFMAARWKNAGNETDLKIISGAPHAFTIISMGDITLEGIGVVTSFVLKKLRA